MDAGNDHTAALTTNSRVAVWGNPIVATASSNPALRSTEPVTAPVVLAPRLLGGSQVVAVVGGDHHVTALTRDGRLWAWGRNSHGQLGDGTAQDRRVPALVRLPVRVRAVSSAGNFLLVLAANGDVYTWGENRFGQLGDGTTNTRGTPARIDALHGALVKEITVGAHAAVLQVDRGPRTGLSLLPPRATVHTNEKLSYSVHARDAFGNDLGRYNGQVTLEIADGRTSRLTVWASAPGRHGVIATAGALTGRAALTVTGRHGGPRGTSTSVPGPRSFR